MINLLINDLADLVRIATSRSTLLPLRFSDVEIVNFRVRCQTKNISIMSVGNTHRAIDL
jgi:hypothetical protein